MISIRSVRVHNYIGLINLLVRPNTEEPTRTVIQDDLRLDHGLQSLT